MSFAITHTEDTVWRVGPGQSQTFGEIKRRVIEAHAHASEPISLGWKRSLHDDIAELKTECAEEGWDGYGADPLSDEAEFRAHYLIDIAPDSIRPPTIVPSPEGEISLEWHNDRNRSLSVTPLGDHLLIYAAILGLEQTRFGREPYSDSWPSSLLTLLREFFPRARYTA